MRPKPADVLIKCDEELQLREEAAIFKRKLPSNLSTEGLSNEYSSEKQNTYKPKGAH
jgi:hypothetical protein